MAGPEDWGATPAEETEGPANWGAKPAGKQFEPAEPDFMQDFLHGFTASGRGALQIAGITPAKAKTHPDKIAQGESDDLSPGSIAGQIAQPLNWIAPGASLLTKAGPLVRGAVAGGVSGLLQPVKEGENFLETKAQQGVAGLALGYGFSLGGKAAGAGISKLGEWLLEKHPDALHNEAVHVVLNKIAKSRYGMSATDAIDVVRAANKGMSRGKGARMMTLSDLKELNRLGGTVYRQSDVGHQMATDLYSKRDPNAALRLRAEVAKHIHSGDTMFETTEALLQARSAAAAPLYEKTDGLQGIWSPRLKEFFDDPIVKEGMKRGFESERARALGEGRPFNPTAMGVDISDPNNIKFLRVPNMRMLDMAKRGLDAVIKDSRDGFTGRLNSSGVDAEIVRKGYIKELESLDKTGTYKAAREAWAGPSRSLDAIQEGYAIFQGKPEEIAAKVAKMDPGDREFYRTGVADAVIEKIMKAGMSSDEAKHIANSSWARAQLRPAFDNDKDFNRFMNSVTIESDMFNSMRKIAGGSDTAERVAADAQGLDALDPAIRIAKQTFSGRLMGAALDSWRLYRELGALKDQKKLTDEVAKIIFQPLSPTAARAHSVLEIRPVQENAMAPAGRGVQQASPFVAAGAAGATVPNEEMGDVVEPQ